MSPSRFFALLCSLALPAPGSTGPFPSAPSVPGSDAIPAASPLFTAWANGIAAFTAGPQEKGTNATPAAYGTPASVTGPPDAAGASYAVPAASPVLSLGDGGFITVTFANPIADGEGPDFAVFENGFGTSGVMLFAELGFVEVSSDGVNFTRFPAVSCTPTATQTNAFTALDPANLHHLAGKHPAGYGTPFDLAALAGTPGLNLQRVTHVRIVDVVGDVKNGQGSRDSLGNWINDPFPTNFSTCGFDLDAVGVIHTAAADPWISWLADSFDAAALADPAITAPDADPDGDGWPNLLEYACGRLPAQRENGPPLTISVAAPQVTLRYAAATRSGVVLHLEQSSLLSGWQPVTAGPGISMEENGGAITVTLPLATQQHFRLMVERQP